MHPPSPRFLSQLQPRLMDLPRPSRRVERRMRNTAQTTSVSRSYQVFYSSGLLTNVTEFAFEIGSSLLTEVRRLQALLAERDKAIQDFKEERDDLERTIEGLKTALRQQEANAGRFHLSVPFRSRAPRPSRLARLDQLSGANQFEYRGES